MVNIPIATVAGVATSNEGKVICVFHEAAYTGQHQSILSCIQMEHHGLDVDDKHIMSGGSSSVATPEGIVFHLAFENGLPYLPLRPFTDSEWDTLPHIIMTPACVWDPRLFDDTSNPRDFTALPTFPHRRPHPHCDLRGEHVISSAIQQEETFDDFWLSDTDYQHTESIVHCMKAISVSRYEVTA